jgi:hypothetical protein
MYILYASFYFLLSCSKSFQWNNYQIKKAQALKGKRRNEMFRSGEVVETRLVSNRFRCPEKADCNVALLSCAASRIRNLVNSPETVNSGTFDSRSLLYHSPSDQFDPNHGCHGPTLLRTNGPVAACTYKRRFARPNKSHAVASWIGLGSDRQRKQIVRDRWKTLWRSSVRIWMKFDFWKIFFTTPNAINKLRIYNCRINGSKKKWNVAKYFDK